jgi:hypothetical protein
MGRETQHDGQEARPHDDLDGEVGRLLDDYTGARRDVRWAGDPAERIDFARALDASALPFEYRTDDALAESATNGATEMARDQALWELAYRKGPACMSVVREVALGDGSAQVRRHGLWMAQKLLGPEARPLFRESAQLERDLTVRNWVSLLSWELGGERTPVYSPTDVKFFADRPFDQTIPLEISGCARVVVPGMGIVRAVLSPLWFEQLLGRVLACTNTHTRDQELVVEKELHGLHADGSAHYEIFKFIGVTERISARTAKHHYESISPRTFYPGGRTEDPTPILDPVPNVGVMLTRIAITEISDTVNIPPKEEMPAVLPPAQRIPGGPQTWQPPARPNLPSLPPVGIGGVTPFHAMAIDSVRGRFFGHAYVNIERVLKGEPLGPGDVQLSTPHDPRVAHCSNAFLFGTFKGVLSDVDGDGRLDLNTVPCHALANGQLDYRLSGTPNADPFDPNGSLYVPVWNLS